MDRPVTALKKELARLGVSQAELSRRIGIDIVQINRWCQGLFVPVDETKSKIAAALGVAVIDLFPADHGDHVPTPADAADTKRRRAA